MPLLSPDAQHVLSGVGAGRVRIDGHIPPGMEHLIAGGWAWQDEDIIVGNGSDDGTHYTLWEYEIPSEVVTQDSLNGATATYGGGGRWVAYLASNSPISYDSDGLTWPDRVARGMSPTGTAVFTSHENDTIYYGPNGKIPNVSVESIQIGVLDVILWATGKQLHAHGAPSPLCPLSGGLGARFATGPHGERVLCQWERDRGALVAYPWVTDGPLPGYVLNVGDHDFRHDIGIRDDGTWVITTGVDEAETQTTLYEVFDGRMRVNGGPWTALNVVRLDQPVMPPIPIPPIPPEPPMPQPTYPITGVYAISHRSTILTGLPDGTLEIDHDPQEYAGWQQVTIHKSQHWTDTQPRVLVEFVAAKGAFRVDAVLVAQQKYDEAISLWPMTKDDVDSGWQNAVPAGNYAHFTGPLVDGRLGAAYTLSIVDATGAPVTLFR